jgi:hypothetical protein
MTNPPASCKVYTPPALARAIVTTLGDEKDSLWLEPSVGHGVFLEELARENVPKHRIWAVDLDPLPHANDTLARTERAQDFLEWSLSTERRFDRVVGNPPYLALRTLDERQKRAALELGQRLGRKITLRTNIWTAFVWGCIHVLRNGGGLGLVLPASFEFADYAAELRRELPLLFKRVEIHRSSEPLFDTVQEGSVVLVCSEYGGPFKGPRHRLYNDVNRLTASLEKECPWEVPDPTEPGAFGGVPLGEFLELRIGAVTGDAGYFLFSESRRLALGLPEAACLPVLTKARHLSAKVGKEEWDALVQQDERVWMFSPAEETLLHPKVAEYVAYGERGSGCRQTYKVRNRSPWYAVPLPECPHAFISGMSYVGPFLAFSEREGLQATNTLYGVRFRSMVEDEKRWSIAISLLTTEVRRQVAWIGRKYPDGLTKLEPKDLLSLRIRTTARRGARAHYQECAALLLKRRFEESQRLADSWFRDRQALLRRDASLNKTRLWRGGTRVPLRQTLKQSGPG